MKIADVKKTIKAYHGPIFVTCCTTTDVYYTKVSKSALLEGIKNLGDNQIDASFTNGVLYIDRSYA